MPAIRRRTGIASVATLTGITATIGLAHLTAPEWTRAAGLDVWNAAAARADLAETRERRAEIDAFGRRLQDLIRESEAVAGRAAAGAVGLAEATDQMDRLNAARPGWEESLVVSHGAAPTHRLRVARYVIMKAAEQFEGDPSGWAAVRSRLETQYRAMGG